MELINSSFTLRPNVLKIELKAVIDTFLTNNLKQYLYKVCKNDELSFRGPAISKFTYEYK